MGDLNRVCCMCGDVGFPDRLFRCARCFARFQHSYCSNYYEEGSSAAGGFCDWCRSEERSASRAHSKRPTAGKDQAATTPGRKSEQPVLERAKQGGGGVEPEEGDGGGRGRSASGAAGLSARPSGRRYKLLKDVLC